MTDIVIRELPAEKYRGWPVRAAYDTDWIYDVEASEDGFRLVPLKLEAPVHREWEDSLFSDWLEAPEAFGAFIGDELIGFIEGSGEKWHGLYRISNLLVYAGHRGMGAAQRLMSSMIAAARASGRWRGVILETQTCNWPAISLYKKLGFRLCRIDTCEYTNDDVARREARIDLILKFE